MPWHRAKNSKSDPYSLLWSEVLGIIECTPDGPSSALLALNGNLDNGSNKPLRVLSTLIKCGIFESLPSLPKELVPTRRWVKTLQQSPNLAKMISIEDFTPEEEIEIITPYPVYFAVKEAHASSAFEADSSMSAYQTPSSSSFASPFGTATASSSASNPFGPHAVFFCPIFTVWRSHFGSCYDVWQSF
jgi:hypothetical protein